MALGFYQVLVAMEQIFSLEPIPDDFAAVMRFVAVFDVDWAGFAYPSGW